MTAVYFYRYFSNNWEDWTFCNLYTYMYQGRIQDLWLGGGVW
jgi:hypothetical protein